ncbi:hypothetical protein CLTEP_07450 [Clostridium tepidiprofundi DSM 19306]|uniref:Spermatogenesis-associated protein 20-like TRX domain-containing protein n=1 Tax=Clostridium tepidiprofundi DSM 19306 TaxID=1121338 RepID=A0A151B5X4_9CLOT|nr:DUF255 domain-containing protein [Clostridium tepidiprofundi]KYH35341.1 hypothetical protein CLTEP_07450 [Clostridium tepidiprofundi DSM 19306]
MGKGDYLISTIDEFANNDLIWYPWEEYVFDKARCENKPIFLSVGYKNNESYDIIYKECINNQKVIKILNNSFIPIEFCSAVNTNIDVYMAACRLLSGCCSLPSSVFLTYDKKLFYSVDIGLNKGSKCKVENFIDILKSIVEVWNDDNKRIIDASNELTKAIHTVFDLNTN